MNLQQFLSTEFQDAQQRLKQIAEQSRAAVKTLTYTCKDGIVPYHVYAGREVEYLSGKISHSTHAMVLHSLALANGQLKRSVLAAGRMEFMQAHSEENVKRVADAMVKNLRAALEDSSQPSSGTYGDSDPLTVSWLADLRCNDIEILEKSELEKIKKVVLHRELRKCFSFAEQEDDKRVNPHAFPVLRQCLIQETSTGKGAAGFKPKRRQYFLERLHHHLSLAAIPDSRFDPAEMVFSLEGALVVDRGSVDANTLDRVIDVLSDSQIKSAYWRPVAPMLFTTRGLALHPLSIEVANSLMRICSMKDEGKRHKRLFARIEPMLQRYYDWLAAQMVTIALKDGRECSGWHSENISDENRIDVWETSQVLNFLQSYSALLHEQIACDALIASGLKVEDLERAEQHALLQPKEYWKLITAKYEPFNVNGHKVFEEIGKYYVLPRADNKPDKSFSMVLYGPPGTGKSTIPEELAKCLKQPLITVTISDFLGDGAAQTEQRAKALFQALEVQHDAVVLFDEIDHFILDRESKIYGEQDTVFQFMPPGMLTKLRDLRQKKNCIFIIATNFMERIDSAAVRLGRIDNRYLVMPPDRAARLRIFKEFDKDKKCEFETVSSAHQARIDALLDDTSFYIYKELDSVWSRLHGSTKIERLSSLMESLSDVAPSTTLSAYRERFKVREDQQLLARRSPIDEFLLLIHYRFCDGIDLDDRDIREKIGSNADLLRAVYDEVVNADGVQKHSRLGKDISAKIFKVLKIANDMVAREQKKH